VKLKYYSILFFAFFAFPVYSDSPHSIHWKKIEAASGYNVEIKTETGKSIFRNTSEPSVTVMLSIGRYTYRIGIYNKLKRIAKWSDWYELEVRPVKPPIVNEQISDFETDGNKRKVTFSGENIFEGTSAYVIQDGKKIPAEVTTSRDRKTSVVSVDVNAVDINKDYKVVLVNPNFEAIEVPLLEKEGSSDENIISQNPEKPSSEGKTKQNGLWPLFWRQALFPGWGHYYNGDHKTAYLYGALFGSAALFGGYNYREYETLNAQLKTQRETFTQLRVLDPDGFTLPFFVTTVLEDPVRNQMEGKVAIINQSLAFMGVVYISSIVHIVYTGLSKKQENSSKQSFHFQIQPEFQNPNDKKLDATHSRLDVNFNFYF